MIQIITDANYSDFGEEFEVSKYNDPKDLDCFDINIIDLSKKSLWVSNSRHYYKLNELRNLATIKNMILESEKAIVVIVFPQNEMIKYDYNSALKRYEKRVMIKDCIQEIMESVLNSFCYGKRIYYLNGATKIENSNIKCDFCFEKLMDLNYEVITKSQNSEKATTIKRDNYYLTTLDIMSSADSVKKFINKLRLSPSNPELPKWLTDLEYFDDNKLNKSICVSSKKLATLKEKIDSEREMLKRNNKYKSILYASGEELKRVVFDMLQQMLEYNLENFVDVGGEDFLIERDDIVITGEIKGINENVRRKDVGQVDNHYQDYIDKKEEDGNKVDLDKVCGVLIINPLRKKPLDERVPIDDDKIRIAERNGSLIITTEVFLKLYEKFSNGKLKTDDIIKLIKENTGLLKLEQI